MVLECPWLAALKASGRSLAGWRSLLRQDQFSGFGDAQNILLSPVDNDHLTGPLHQISGADPFALRPR
jgi:hypothetical protein